MNLQMLDHFEKIISPSPEHDRAILHQAGLIDFDAVPDVGAINLLVGRCAAPLADNLCAAGISLSEVVSYCQELCDSGKLVEVHLLLLFLFETLDIPTPSYFMLLPACPPALEIYISELLADFRDINSDE